MNTLRFVFVVFFKDVEFVRPRWAGLDQAGPGWTGVELRPWARRPAVLGAPACPPGLPVLGLWGVSFPSAALPRCPAASCSAATTLFAADHFSLDPRGGSSKKEAVPEKSVVHF